MKPLLPCRMPAWLAEVCDGRRAVQRSSVIFSRGPSVARCGTRPARIWWARIGWARPSIWTMTTPGLSVWITSWRLAAAGGRASQVGIVAAVDREHRRSGPAWAMAYTIEPTKAVRTPITWNLGDEPAEERKTPICKTSVAIATR